MSTVGWLFHEVKRFLGSNMGLFALLAYWISLEYFQYYSGFSGPWLNLGNGLGNDILLVQWYDTTGILGGTAWILLVNFLFFQVIKSFWYRRPQAAKSQAIILFIFIIIPIAISIYKFYTYENKGILKQIAIIQPNIDPYTQKFNSLTSDQQLDIILELADSISDQKTDYILAPETALTEIIWEDEISDNPQVKKIKNFLSKNPGMKFVTGAYTNRYLAPFEEKNYASRVNEKGKVYVSYNSAILIDTGHTQVYHKTILVPGVEKPPFIEYVRFLENLSIDLGGVNGSLASGGSDPVFQDSANEIKIAPIICYESLFGNYLNESILQGANFVFIMTNDGWWKNSPGHLVHHRYAKIRAIETRRNLARAANTGLSSFINQKGEVVKKINYGKKGSIKETLKANEQISFYSRNGEYIARVSLFFAVITLLYYFSKRMRSQKIK